MLSKKAQALGDKDAFPVVICGAPPGMSYRHWLIGQALSGLGADHAMSTTETAHVAISVTDKILEVLASEVEPE